jgi:RES domain-containing protein
MLLYRISKAEHVRDLTGAGARLYGGRWNHRGVPLIYASESRSLATVEYLVHMSLPEAPGDLCIATLDVPHDVVPEEMDPSSLPRDWRENPAPVELADVGTEWARSKRSLLLRVPSAVVEHEHNVLLNPAHDDMSRVRLTKIEPCTLDERLIRERPAGAPSPRSRRRRRRA